MAGAGVESEDASCNIARKAYVVCAMAVGIACGRDDTQTVDLRAKAEWCTREHDGGVKERNGGPT